VATNHSRGAIGTIILAILTIVLAVSIALKPTERDQLEETNREAIPYETQYTSDKSGELWEFETDVTRSGQEGERVTYDLWRETYVLGRLRDREKVDTKVEEKPSVAETISYGVKRGHPTGYAWPIKITGYKDPSGMAALDVDPIDAKLTISELEVSRIEGRYILHFEYNLSNLGDKEIYEAIAHEFRLFSKSSTGQPEMYQWKTGDMGSGHIASRGSAKFAKDYDAIRSPYPKDYKIIFEIDGPLGTKSIHREISLDKLWIGTFNKDATMQNIYSLYTPAP